MYPQNNNTLSLTVLLKKAMIGFTKQGNGKAPLFSINIQIHPEFIKHFCYLSQNESKVTLALIITSFLKYPEVCKFSDT